MISRVTRGAPGRFGVTAQYLFSANGRTERLRPSTNNAVANKIRRHEHYASEYSRRGPGDLLLCKLWLSLASFAGCGASADPQAAQETKIGGPVVAPPQTAQCEAARWTIPAVPRADLDAHDLKWVDSSWTACCPGDVPQGADPKDSLMCSALRPDLGALSYLGLKHPNQSGAFSTPDVISPKSFAWLDGPRHIYKYGDHVYITTSADEAHDQLNVFFTLRALEILRTKYPQTQEYLFTEMSRFPTRPALEGTGWKNRVMSFIFSFDPSPEQIAAGITAIDAAPKKDPNTGLDLYENTAIISIDSETILGRDSTAGSRPLYGMDDADENYLRYMREGLHDTIVHEVLHRLIDRLNSVDPRMNVLYNRRSGAKICEPIALEEALVASSSLALFRRTGLISTAYLQYYDQILDENRRRIAQCPEAAQWAKDFASQSSEPRYQMSLLNLP